MEVMGALSAGVVPALIAAVVLLGLLERRDVFAAFTRGAGEGLKVAARIMPSLVGMLTAIYMLRASGLLDALTSLLTPALRVLRIPEEMAPLMLIRPLSGSGALAVGSAIIETWGPDSLLGYTAAVMLGSTETTFYTVSVYFGALGIRRTRYAIPAALCADMTGFAAAAFFTRLFFA